MIEFISNSKLDKKVKGRRLYGIGEFTIYNYEPLRFGGPEDRLFEVGDSIHIKNEIYYSGVFWERKFSYVKLRDGVNKSQSWFKENFEREVKILDKVVPEKKLISFKEYLNFA